MDELALTASLWPALAVGTDMDGRGQQTGGERGGVFPSPRDELFYGAANRAGSTQGNPAGAGRAEGRPRHPTRRQRRDGDIGFRRWPAPRAPS